MYGAIGKRNQNATSRTRVWSRGGTTAFVLVKVQRVPETGSAHVRAPVHVDIRAGIDTQERHGRVFGALADGRPVDGAVAGRRYPAERRATIRTRRPAEFEHSRLTPYERTTSICPLRSAPTVCPPASLRRSRTRFAARSPCRPRGWLLRESTGVRVRTRGRIFPDRGHAKRHCVAESISTLNLSTNFSFEPD